jgi:hypothetical protein
MDLAEAQTVADRHGHYDPETKSNGCDECHAPNLCDNNRLAAKVLREAGVLPSRRIRQIRQHRRREDSLVI